MALILVVDDDVPIIKFAKTMLERDGHTVFTATNGIEAAEVIVTQNAELDIIISDFRMPELDGLGLYIWITSEFPELATKFVFHTGNVDELDGYHQAKGVRKIDKPGHLIQMVRELLSPAQIAV